MKREVQKAFNREVLTFLESYSRIPKRVLSENRLRSCNAYVRDVVNELTGEVYHELISYATPVAIIDGDKAYDFLRLAYGYTATSAKHIAKFFHDYAPAHRREYLIERRWKEI